MIFENKINDRKVTIYFKGYNYETYVDPIFEIKIDNELVEVIADEKICFIDVDESDDYFEIVAGDRWENGCNYVFYRYSDSIIVNLGTACDFINVKLGTCLAVEDECYAFEEEVLVPRYYEIENDELVRKTLYYKDVEEKKYTVTEDVLKKFDIEDLKIGEKIKILAIDDEDDMRITDFSQGIALKILREDGRIDNVGYAGSLVE